MFERLSRLLHGPTSPASRGPSLPRAGISPGRAGAFVQNIPNAPRAGGALPPAGPTSPGRLGPRGGGGVRLPPMRPPGGFMPPPAPPPAAPPAPAPAASALPPAAPWAAGAAMMKPSKKFKHPGHGRGRPRRPWGWWGWGPYWDYGSYCDLTALNPCLLPNYGCLQEWTAARYRKGACYDLTCPTGGVVRVCI